MNSYLQLLLLFSVVYCQDEVPSSLSGYWVNELGSWMNIDSLSPAAGQFVGLYCSAVGNATLDYILTGRYDDDGSECGGTLGWTVTWKNKYGNSKSTTTWSGQRQLSQDMRPVLITTWLLTGQTDPENNWQSTTTNKDTFRRPTPEELEISGEPCGPSTAA